MKYKVEYSGFAYVEADSEEDAIDDFECGQESYDERNVDSVKEVDEFCVEV